MHTSRCTPGDHSVKSSRTLDMWGLRVQPTRSSIARRAVAALGSDDQQESVPVFVPEWSALVALLAARPLGRHAP